MNDTIVGLLVSARNQRFILGNPLSHSIHAISDQILVIPLLSYLLDPILALHVHCQGLSLDAHYLLPSCVSPRKSCPPFYQKDFSSLPIWSWCPVHSLSDILLCPHTTQKEFHNLAPTCLSSAFTPNVKLCSRYSKSFSVLWMYGNMISAFLSL